MKRKNKRLIWIIAFVAVFAFMLTARQLIEGLRQTNPKYNGPPAIMKWWNDQKSKP